MRRSLWIIVALLAVVAGTPRVAAADTITVGLFSLDDLGNGTSVFDITNLTPGLTIAVTNVTADLSGGGSLTIPSGDFTTDGSGNVNCTTPGFAPAGCNVAAFSLSSATLTGTLFPTSGFPGIPPGFVGIESAFTAILLPSGGPVLIAGLDVTTIDATLVPATITAPEPSTGPLLAIGFIGLLAGCGANRRSRLAKRPVALRS